jgi:predicted ATPase
VLQQVLTIAAFLGFSFDERVLEELVALERSNYDSTEAFVDVSSVLLQVVEHGLLEETATHSSNKFMCSHDGVRQVLYSTVEDVAAQQKMHLRIARLVKRMWDAECENGFPQDTWKLFIACDQLNDGSPQLIDSREKMDLVRLNLQTAKVAIQKSDLPPAAEYLWKAIAIIEEEHEHWTTDYDLCLDLYGTAAKIGVLITGKL